MNKKPEVIQKIRAFNRFYTDMIGLLDQHILNSRFSLPEVRVLYEINALKTGTATQIMERMSIDAGYLSRLLKGFERSKIIRRRKTASDARASEISLTSKGQKLFDQLDKASEDQILDLLAHLPAARQEELSEWMERIKIILAKRQA